MLDLQSIEVIMYWEALETLVEKHPIIIDRPKGSRHPKYRDIVYPIDYGYLENTTTVDGNGIDIFVGSKIESGVNGLICTVDLLKNDAEIKIMYNCTKDEIDSALSLLNGKYMSGIFIPNEQNPKEY
jgi:inorganic pyrophosphatase